MIEANPNKQVPQKRKYVSKDLFYREKYYLFYHFLRCNRFVVTGLSRCKMRNVIISLSTFK